MWIQIFKNISEFIFDLEDYLNKCESREEVKLTETIKKLIEKIRRSWSHVLKFNIDLYLNVSRSTLSLHSKGFESILTNKYEMNYPSPQDISMPVQERSPGLFRR